MEIQFNSSTVPHLMCCDEWRCETRGQAAGYGFVQRVKAAFWSDVVEDVCRRYNYLPLSVFVPEKRGTQQGCLLMALRVSGVKGRGCSVCAAFCGVRASQ